MCNPRAGFSSGSPDPFPRYGRLAGYEGKSNSDRPAGWGSPALPSWDLAPDTFPD